MKTAGYRNSFPGNPNETEFWVGEVLSRRPEPGVYSRSRCTSVECLAGGRKEVLAVWGGGGPEIGGFFPELGPRFCDAVWGLRMRGGGRGSGCGVGSGGECLFCLVWSIKEN